MTSLVARIDITTNVNLDTDTGVSNVPGLGCAATDDPTICAIAAATIMIADGAILSAHGSRPLALLGHSIHIRGTVDVASHLHGQRGAGSRTGGCSAGAPAIASGGGAGGTFTADGADGGEQGGATNTGGRPGASISTAILGGGCDGGRGGNGTPDGGPPSPGGAGGGAVWIAVDTSPLVLGPAAAINASGAGAQGGAAGIHGGDGAGSGGFILLLAPTITVDPTAVLFANGGHGGGGSQGNGPGGDGTDPTGPTSGGGGGSGGGAGGPITRSTPPNDATPPGGGGPGYPDPSPNGASGDLFVPGGGGGGGGGPGAIIVFSSTSLGGPTFSPPPTHDFAATAQPHRASGAVR